MPKSRRLRRTKRMRGGDATMTTAMPTETTTMPTETTATAITTTTVADKLKNATRKATDWLKGWFGVGQQPQMGGRRRKTRRHRSRKH